MCINVHNVHSGSVPLKLIAVLGIIRFVRTHEGGRESS